MAISHYQQRNSTLTTRKPLARKTGLQRAVFGKKSPPKRRKTTKAAARRRKRGEWSTASADKYFSLYIRERDGKCLRCGTKDNLTCSHYHRRGHSATRYDLENCVALCAACHAEWEGPKNEYTQFMLNWLGQEKFIALSLRAGTMMKRSDAVAAWKYLYDTL